MKTSDDQTLKRALGISFGLLFILWAIRFSEIIMGWDFTYLGIFPRTLKGLPGIFFSPFIHADLSHLYSNSFSAVILTLSLYYFFRKSFSLIFFLMVVLTGTLVWLFGRSAYHLGYSGIIYSMSFFLLFLGFWKMDRSLLAVSFIVLIIQGSGLFTGLFPTSAQVSWEAHSMGALSGLFLGFIFRNQYRSPFSTSQSENENFIETDSHEEVSEDFKPSMRIEFRDDIGEENESIDPSENKNS